MQDTGYVNGRAVGGTEDFILGCPFNWCTDEKSKRGEDGEPTTVAGIPILVSFFLYSTRDLVLLFVTKTTCLPVRIFNGENSLSTKEIYLYYAAALMFQRCLQTYDRRTIRRLSFLRL